MSNSMFSAYGLISRRTAAAFAVGVALIVLLMLSVHSTPASADPYPPTNPTTSSGILPTSESRVPSSSSSVANVSTNRSEGLSSTGFQTLAATIIAVALIGGGAIFLGLGRSRRHG